MVKNKNEKDELKPCPFCGGSAIMNQNLVHKLPDGTPYSYIICNGCNISVALYVRVESTDIIASVFSALKPGYLGYTNTVSYVWVTAPVCSINNDFYYSLDDALVAVTTGQTIMLWKNIDYTGQISVSVKTITFNMNGFNLNVVNTTAGGTGLSVTSNGQVNMTGTGQFNVTGVGYGVSVTGGGKATVTNATATDVCGVYANGAGSSVTVIGNVSSNNSYGVDSRNGGKITIGGNISATGTYAGGINVDGSGSEVTVIGNVNGEGSGANASFGGKATIDGIITTSGTYVSVGGPKTAASGVPSTIKQGYLEYTDGTSYVWVAKAIQTGDFAMVYDSNTLTNSGTLKGTVTVKITNITGRTVPAVAVLAVYDVNRKLLYTGFTDVQISAGTANKTVALPVAGVSGVNSGATYKVMLWQSVQGMLPLCPAVGPTGV